MLGLPDETKKPTKRYGIVAVVAVILAVGLFCTNLFSYLRIAATSIDSKSCPIVDIYRPQAFYKDNSTVVDILFGDEFKKAAVKKWSKAVQVDTQIYDNPPGVEEDPEYWTKFVKFHEYLEEAYPAVHKHLELTKVNTYGLVYFWKGSNPDLKPLMLAGHQDVVPVQQDTLKDWSYPPFEGHFDGEKLYGRGAADCKNVLTSIMESLELLVNQGFQPERGIIAAFGMDEEVSGWHGASKINDYLEKRFGKDSLYAIVDEGAGVTKNPITDTLVALPGTGEKGYIDVEVELTTPGGHSSIPPDHTSIGIMSELATKIEGDPFEPILTKQNPSLEFFQCCAIHDHKGKLPKLFKKLILRAGYDKVANALVTKALSQNLISRYLIQTSQALDIVKGGEKNNALPENVKLLVNHRVAVETSIEEVQARFVQRVEGVAKSHGLGLRAFGKELIEATGNGIIEVKVDGKFTQTAPVTPTGDKLWKLLAGVTRHIIEDFVFTDLEEPLVVAPSIMTGNTDTRHYWSLTDHIYRYSPMYIGDFIKDTNIHSVDEKLDLSSHLQLTAFFYEFIQAVQE